MSVQTAPAQPADRNKTHDQFVRVCLGWIIALLVIVAIAAVIVSWNVISLDLFIHHLQQAVNQFNPSPSSTCQSQGGFDPSC